VSDQRETPKPQRHRWTENYYMWGVVGCNACPWTRRRAHSTAVRNKPWWLYVRITDGLTTLNHPSCSISGGKPRKRR
jgi:hypothetical protein